MRKQIPIAACMIGAWMMYGAPVPQSRGTSVVTRKFPEPENSKLPTLWLIGDSTVRNGRGDGANGQWGWGDLIAPYFDASKFNIVNCAVGGRSSRTYLTEGVWDTVLAKLKPGDFVMMQFGHNDSGPSTIISARVAPLLELATRLRRSTIS